MSNEYLLIEDKTIGLPTKEITILEHSCKFDIIVDRSFSTGRKNMLTEICDLSAQDLEKLAINILQICSYFTDDPNEILDRYNLKSYRNDVIVRKPNNPGT